MLAPQAVDERVHRHRLTGVHHQDGEHGALLMCPQSDRKAVVSHLQIAEDQELHFSTALSRHERPYHRQTPATNPSPTRALPGPTNVPCDEPARPVIPEPH